MALFVYCTLYKGQIYAQGFTGIRSCTAMGDESYQSVQPTTLIGENEYELTQYVKREKEPKPHIVPDSKSPHQSVWSIPVIMQTVLMCIILLLYWLLLLSLLD